jgi:hypothetical protein
MRLVAVAVALLAGCSSSSGDTVTPTAPPTPTHSTAVVPPVTLAAVAQQLSALDHAHGDRAYLGALHPLHRRCTDGSPAALKSLVTGSETALANNDIAGASYLSVLQSLSGAVTAKSGADCSQVRREFTAEVTGPSQSAKNYAGYAATTTAWDAAHHVDAANPDGYLPKLANGDDTDVIGGAGRVTTLTRNFDPPLSQPVAIGVIRHQLLPGGLHSVYTLPTPNCYEVIYLSPALGTLLGSSAAGVMIELSSGHGVTSHYDTSLVDRAILTVGGRIGGQPCV